MGQHLEKYYSILPIYEAIITTNGVIGISTISANVFELNDRPRILAVTVSAE